MFTIIDYVQELFDVVAETESESDGSATNISEASRTGSSSGHSHSSDGPSSQGTNQRCICARARVLFDRTEKYCSG